MGCAICLDDFNQADGDAKRATALPCGHIFHYDCLQTWFYGSTATDTNRPNQKRCPLCSVTTNPTSMVRLFPSDGDDLDTYLSGQQLWDLELKSLHGPVPPGQDNLRGHKELLNDLMDFNKAVQSYVMATHYAHVDKMLKSGVKVRKLVVDLTKHRTPDLDESLMSAMDALENAASSFSTLFNDLSRRVRDNRKREVELEKQKHKLETELRQAEDKTRAANVQLDQARQARKQAEELVKEVNDRDRRVTGLIIEISGKEEDLKARERDVESQRRAMALETSIKLSNMKSTTDAQLADMRAKLDAAEKKRDEAEKEKDASHNKSCHLAKQLKKMQEQLQSRKTPPHPAASDSRSSDMALLERKNKALQALLSARDAQLKELGMVTPDRCISRSSNRLSSQSFVDLTRSSSPFGNENVDSPATPRDGFEITSQTSTIGGAAPARSPTPQRRAKKRARSSLSIEPERLDDEMDEALFPMPGFAVALPPRRTAAVHVRFQSDDAASPVAAKQPAASTNPTTSGAAAPTSGVAPGFAGSSVAGSKGPLRKNLNKRKARSSDPTASTSTSTSTSNPNYDWLNKSNGIAFGPKRRSKAM
ncbi:uncharacterized protein UTRI_06173_B [Ustilago trichophora]|uniref:RING-type domain-containing protein n=1 Tax=Ustilago trichophora TaxID=86804 RepID=A0A5C3EJR9_9BASI|nr:uncharacterized protein UTRI_06173_B [Ustilago trichophora]